jgi:hypothetical protein
LGLLPAGRIAGEPFYRQPGLSMEFKLAAQSPGGLLCHGDKITASGLVAQVDVGGLAQPGGKAGPQGVAMALQGEEVAAEGIRQFPGHQHSGSGPGGAAPGLPLFQQDYGLSPPGQFPANGQAKHAAADDKSWIRGWLHSGYFRRITG